MLENQKLSTHTLQPDTPLKKNALVGRKVFVQTTGRLHMGFFDLNGGLGRKFGSIGLSLDAPVLHLSAEHRAHIEVRGAQHLHQNQLARVEKSAKQFLAAVGIESGAHIWVDDCIDTHAGLGSGTQISIAVGTALSQLYQLNLSTANIAQLMQRGARSGIGIAAFDQGGLIIDGGRNSYTVLPPIIARYDFPTEWCILLIFDHQQQGVNGAEELIAFNELPAFSEEIAAHLCRQVLMQAMPALVERDLKSFGQSIQALQQHVGDYFAPAQGGRYASQHVSAVLEKLEAMGVACFGQSSWGPTGFAVFENASVAETALSALKDTFLSLNLDWRLTHARNHGAEIKVKS